MTHTEGATTMTAADAFRAWRPPDPPSTFDAFHAGFLACAAEAERLCFEQEKECKHANPCHAADADAISALREVDR